MPSEDLIRPELSIFLINGKSIYTDGMKEVEYRSKRFQKGIEASEGKGRDAQIQSKSRNGRESNAVIGRKKNTKK